MLLIVTIHLFQMTSRSTVEPLSVFGWDMEVQKQFSNYLLRDAQQKPVHELLRAVIILTVNAKDNIYVNIEKISFIIGKMLHCLLIAEVKLSTENCIIHLLKKPCSNLLFVDLHMNKIVNEFSIQRIETIARRIISNKIVSQANDIKELVKRIQKYYEDHKSEALF